MKNYLLTYKNLRFDPLKPTVDMIDIRDIAHALSQVCRFSGQSPSYYSVADHSVHVSEILEFQRADRELQLAGLLHDAAEAYIADVPTPVKINLPAYKEIEDTIIRVIFKKFNLPFSLYAKVKQADIVALKTEFRDIIGQGLLDHPDVPCHERVLKPSGSPLASEVTFLRLYSHLVTGGHK